MIEFVKVLQPFIPYPRPINNGLLVRLLIFDECVESVFQFAMIGHGTDSSQKFYGLHTRCIASVEVRNSHICTQTAQTPPARFVANSPSIRQELTLSAYT